LQCLKLELRSRGDHKLERNNFYEADLYRCKAATCAVSHYHMQSFYPPEQYVVPNLTACLLQRQQSEKDKKIVNVAPLEKRLRTTMEKPLQWLGQCPF